MSGRSYLYAESALVLTRLPERFCFRLESTTDPIGRILKEEEIAVTREALTGSDVGIMSVPPGVTMTVHDDILTRTYRVDIKGVPVMAIAEWFLSPLEGFLPPQ